MKHLKIMKVCLVAVFALSAVTVTTASAQKPEEGPELVKKGGGELVKKGIAGTSKATKIVLEIINGDKLECTGLSATGKAINGSEGEQTLTITGCSSIAGKCKTKEEKEGKKIEGKEGEIIIRASVRPRWRVFLTSIGLLISILPITSFDSFTCGNGTISIHLIGSFIVPLSVGLNTPFSTLIASAKASKGVQEPTEYEIEKGGKKEKIKNTLEAEGIGLGEFKKQQAAVEDEEEVKFEEEVEFRE